MAAFQAIPGWIHGLEEYEQMFDLHQADFKKSILDFPGSISSFNADIQQYGTQIISGDAIYGKSWRDMQAYAEQLILLNREHLTTHAKELLKHGNNALSAIFEMWDANAQRFLADYEKGCEQKRYQQVLMPELPYENHQFELALCSDYVFNRHAQNDCRPEQVVSELCRVAEEVRVFPLLTEKGELSEQLGPLMLELQQRNFGIEIRQVEFENLNGGNAMLRIWARECSVD